MKYIDSILYAYRRSTIKLLIIFSHLATVTARPGRAFSAAPISRVPRLSFFLLLPPPLSLLGVSFLTRMILMRTKRVDRSFDLSRTIDGRVALDLAFHGKKGATEKIVFRRSYISSPAFLLLAKGVKYRFRIGGTPSNRIDTNERDGGDRSRRVSRRGGKDKIKTKRLIESLASRAIGTGVCSARINKAHFWSRDANAARLFSQTARLYETVKTSYRIRTPRAGFRCPRLSEDSRFSSSSVILRMTLFGV